LKYIGICICLLFPPSAFAGGLKVKKVDPQLKEVENLVAKIGEVWNRTYDGGIMIYEPEKGRIVTNINTVEEDLKSRGGRFVGKLPKNTPKPKTGFSWGGRQWVVTYWPVSKNNQADIIHDMYLFYSSKWYHKGDWEPCDYLKDPKAKELLDLEFRALKVAAETSGNLQISHIRSGFYFRTLRYKLFPQAQILEARLECSKGLEAYTEMCIKYPARQGKLKYLADKFQDPSSQNVDQFYKYTASMYALMLDKKGHGTVWKDYVRAETNVGMKWAAFNFMKINDNLEEKVEQYKDLYLKESYLKE